MNNTIKGILLAIACLLSFLGGFKYAKQTQNSDVQTQIERLKIEKLKLEIWEIRRKHERINNK